MSLNIPDEYVPLIVNALQHYYAYTRAAQREDSRYQQAAEWFVGKPPAPAGPRRAVKRKRRYVGKLKTRWH